MLSLKYEIKNYDQEYPPIEPDKTSNSTKKEKAGKKNSPYATVIKQSSTKKKYKKFLVPERKITPRLTPFTSKKLGMTSSTTPKQMTNEEAEKLLELDPDLIISVTNEDTNLENTMAERDEKFDNFKKEMKGEMKEMKDEMRNFLKDIQETVASNFAEKKKEDNEKTDPDKTQLQPPDQHLASSSNKKYAFGFKEFSVKTSTALAISKYITYIQNHVG